MIFVDTSAFYAVLDRDDRVHELARATWVETLSSSGSPGFVTSNYVLVESFALIQARLGMEAVRSFHDSVLPVVRLEWIRPEDHSAACICNS